MTRSSSMGIGDSPFRSRAISEGVLYTDEAGRFGLQPHGDAVDPFAASSNSEANLNHLSGLYLKELRRMVPDKVDYLILVPTLRCDLACSYCQVSRASVSASGYDWNNETLEQVCSLLSGLTAPTIKVEFQGGEPTLRTDLIAKVISAVPSNVEAQFVICTNLQNISAKALEIFDRPNVVISTSLDGPLDVHSRQRGRGQATKVFAENLAYLVERYGSKKISALPTIDPFNPPSPQELVDAFAEFGLHSIYLRPINYQGFARKKHTASRDVATRWSHYHRNFIEYLIERNWCEKSTVIEESYFSTILRRIFRPGANRHVDLRNPNPVGRDYIVIDFDGLVYPTDEARMLTRAGVIDLSIGNVATGWDTPERALLDAASTLDGDPDCEACVYKPYCGRDVIDDISRYGTVAIRRAETEFCRRHISLFDLAFTLIYSEDERVRYSLGRWLDLPGPMPAMRTAS